MLSASEKTLQRARSETVNSLAVGSFCFMNPWGGTLCPFCCNGTKVVVLRYVTLRDQRVPHKKQKTFSPNSACTYPFLLRYLGSIVIPLEIRIAGGQPKYLSLKYLSPAANSLEIRIAGGQPHDNNC